MPSVPSVPIPNQVSLNSGVLPYVQQMNFGQMIGAVVSDTNPNAVAKVPVWINEIVRQIYAKRTWYGLYTKGQITPPNAVNGGQATVTLGSQIVQGTGTSWDSTLVGRQFRLGLNTPPYTIIAVNFGLQQLTLDLPWGGPFPPNQTTQTAGYTILQMYYNLGPNIKYLKQMVNFQMGFKLWRNLTQDWLDNYDAWRVWQNFPWAAAPLPTDSNGNYLIELWPAPITQQVLPFYAYIQPANLVDDIDTLPPYVRCDVVLKEARCWALRYNPKNNPLYDAGTALELAREYHQEYLGLLQDWQNEDENLYRISTTIPGEDLPYYQPSGALWDAFHAVMAGGPGGDDGW